MQPDLERTRAIGLWFVFAFAVLWTMFGDHVKKWLRKSFRNGKGE